MQLLTSVPLEAWAGLLGVAIGSALSLLGTWLSNQSNLKQLRLQLRHQQQSKEEDVLRARLEELYTLVASWLNFMAGQHISVAMIMQGKLTYNEHYDLLVKDESKKAYDFSRIEMIIDVYGKSLHNSYQAVIEIRDRLNKLEGEFKRRYEEGGVGGREFLREYLQAQFEIAEKGRLLKRAIAEKAKNA